MVRQRGFEMSDFLMWVVIAGIIGFFGFKIGPSYYEYYNVVKVFKAIAADPAVAGGSKKDIEAAFANRAQISGITSVTPADLEVNKDDGRVVISASYSARVPIAGNLSATMDFFPSSASK
mgnify:CR=1 FL=1